MHAFGGDFLKLWKWVFVLSPLWWFLGMNLFIYQLAALALLFRFILIAHREWKGISFSSSFIWLLVFILIYSFSLFIRCFDSPFSRIMASGYNLSLWVMGLVLILVFSNTFQVSEIRTFTAIFPPLAWVTGVTAIAMLLLGLQGWRSMGFDTPLYRLFSNNMEADLLWQTLEVRLLFQDWLAETSWPRFNFLLPYPTATSALIALMLVFSYADFILGKNRKKIFFLPLLFVSLLGLVMTASRTSFMALCLSVSWVYLFENKISPARIFLFILLAGLVYTGIQPFMEYVLKLRWGSTRVRFDLYKATIDQLSGLEWLFGHGVKPRMYDFSIPIGSHSTYLSLLFKTGLLGAGTFILFQGDILLKWHRLNTEIHGRKKTATLSRSLGIAMFFMGFWMITEDIDAPQLLAFLYFSLIGIFEGMRRNVLKPDSR